MKTIFKLVTIALCVLEVAKASDKSIKEYLSEADVGFDIEKMSSSLSIVAKEHGRDVLKAEISDRNFNGFYTMSRGNFYLERLGQDLKLSFNRLSEKFAIVINKNGNVQMDSDSETYTGFDKYRRYVIKTTGTIENRGNQAFYFLALSADQIHNYGTIQALSGHNFLNYKFNSGVWKYGEIPTANTDLREKISQAKPQYKRNVIENYGKYISSNGMKIKDGLCYHDYSETDFENLEMFGGDIVVHNNGVLNIEQKLSGSVKTLEIGENASMIADEISITKVDNLAIKSNGILHVNKALNLRVSGGYINQGNITSDDRISLTSDTARSNQRGLLFARNGVNFQANDANYERECEAARRARAEAQIKRIEAEQDALEKAVKYEVKSIPVRLAGALDMGLREMGFHECSDGYYRAQSRGGGMVFSLGIGTSGIRFSGATRGTRPPQAMTPQDLRQRFPDFYNARDALRTALERVSYYRDLENKPMPRKRNVALGVVGRPSDRKVVEVQDRVRVQRNHVCLNRERERMENNFFQGLRSSMVRSGIAQNEINAIFTDTDVVRVLRNLRGYNSPLTTANNYYTGVLQRLSIDAQDRVWWNRDFTGEQAISYIESAAYNPLEDYIIKNPEFLLGPAELALSAARTVGAMVLERVAPKLLAAKAVGDAWDNFLSYMKGGKDAVKRPTSSAPAPRVQATRADADGYLRGLTDQKGVLSKKGITKDGHDFFRFERNCEYKGIQFKKGDYISRDKLHHEWEYFSNPATHKGAIDPLTGKLNISKAEAGRILRLP